MVSRSLVPLVGAALLLLTPAVPAGAATILEKGGSPWPEAFRRAIGVLIKDEEDLSHIAPELGRIVEEALA